MFNKIVAYTPFIGNTGFANHGRNFFTSLNQMLPVIVKNQTYNSEVNLSNIQKDMLDKQSWPDPPYEIGKEHYKDEKIINISLVETGHTYNIDNIHAPSICYNVWESTRQPDQFFKKLKEFNQIWVPTMWQKMCSIDQGIEESKIFVVPEGVDINIFKPIECIKNDTFRFMIFGRWEHRKYTREMISAFIETFNNNEDVELLISVDNDFPIDSYKTTEERLKSYNLIDKRIKVLHHPSDEDYVRYLQTGNVLLMASRSEGWGLPIGEALACGTPTIITDYGAPLSFADTAYKVKVKEFKRPKNVYGKNGVTGVWAEPDYSDLKDKMRYVYDNFAMCKKHTMQNIDKIRKFTWDNASHVAYDILKNSDFHKFYPVNIDFSSLNENFPSNSVDNIDLSDKLENNKFDEIKNILDNCYDILKFDGKLEFTIQNLDYVVDNWGRIKNKTSVISFMLDKQFLFTKEIIDNLLKTTGFNNISYKNIESLIDVVAIKKKFKYDDEMIVIDCYPDSEEKVKILKEKILSIKNTGLKTAVVTHLPLEREITESVDFVIYDGNNPLSDTSFIRIEDYVEQENVKIVSRIDKPYHGLCCLNSIKNVADFFKNKFEYIHFIEYDADVDVESYIKKAQLNRELEKDFVCFDYHYDIPKQDGIITNVFSFNPSWISDILQYFRNWSEYKDFTIKSCEKSGKMVNFILEQWLWDILAEYPDNIGFLIKDDYDEVVFNINKIDQTGKTPSLYFKISETSDDKIILFVINNDNIKKSYKIRHYTNITESVVDHISYHIFDKHGTLSIEYENKKEEIKIDSFNTYNNNIFKFYNNEYICDFWEDRYNTGFINNDIFKYSFNDGPKVEIIGDSESIYDVEFINKDTGLCVYKTSIQTNEWAKSSVKYLVNWDITVRSKGRVVSKHNFNLTDRSVFIHFDSKSLGDTIAWVPYVEEFRKKHSCNVFCGTFHNNLFKDVYQNINFIEGDEGIKFYASYSIGCWDNDYSINKNNWRLVPLQQVCSDILNLDYKEIRPKIIKSDQNRPISNKYVTISEHSTFQCKYWLYPDGWQTIVDYINSIGYDVMVISKEKTLLKNIIDMTGKPIEQTINNIQHSEMFIGISSGPSWLAWALDIPVILISGYSEKWAEFNDNCYRIVTPDEKCHGCFNNLDNKFDRGNWNFCPRNKNFECSTTIHPDSVIDGINSLIITAKC